MTEVKEVVKTSRKYYPYSQYRDAEVECLDSIPSHWQAHALKHALEIRITDGPHETPEFLDEGVPFVSAEAVAKGYIDFNKIRGYISVEDDKRFSRKYSPQKHDVYMVKSGATTGVTAIVETEQHFNIWSPLAVMRCNQGFEPYYLLNYLRSRSFRESVELNWSFGTQQNIGMGTLENLPICHPPIDEQRTIAAFLDYETARIDSLIDKQQRLIELLKEKRQAVISHAVTKGLNPDAPMKDSGVEWLGQVPEHWGVMRLKQVLSSPMMYGANEAALDDNPDNPRFIRITDMNADGTLKQSTFKSLEPNVAKPYLLKDKDLLLARSGATVGKSFLYKAEYGTACFAGYLIKAELDKSKLLPEYAYLYSQSIPYWEFITGNQIQATIQNVSAEKYGNLFIPIPSIDEQLESIHYLQTAIQTFADFESKAQLAIELMQERRTALISAAVTGKIDLRGWTPPVREDAA